MVDVTVSRSLSTEPEHRYQTAAELREALEAALRDSTASPRRTLLRRSLASAVALVLLAGIGVAAARPDLRSAALSAVAPVAERVRALQARAAERFQSAHPSVAHAALAAPPLELSAPPSAGKPEDVELPSMALGSPSVALEPAPPLAPVAQATAADEGEVDDDSSPADAIAPVKAEPEAHVATSSAADAAITEARALVSRGNQLKALNLLRRAAKSSPNHPALLQELAAAAERDRAWGEAVRVARRLVVVDPSSETKLELARLERKTGHRARALELVRSVVKDAPDSPEARAMLSQLGGVERVALQK